MIEIENKLDAAQAIPLQESNAPETFYAGANRGEVLLQMSQALEQGASLLVLTGEEGSGKTTLCRLLEREASQFCFTVFLTKSVESFEDVVKKMAMWLGLSIEGGFDAKNVDKALDSITAHLKRESMGLLVIFDEAENIYLATLERIRKMLDRLTQAGAHMHIVFSGREVFLHNYQQLAICGFDANDQLQFELAPLSEQETGEYLHAYSMDAETRRVFNDEIIRNIFSIAKGNFRKTNLLAEESLRTHGDDTSFMVLLENVKEENGVGTVQRRRRKKQEKPRPQRKLLFYMPWVGGIGCILLLLIFFLIRPNVGEQNKGKAEAPKGTAEKVQTVETEKRQPEPKAAEPKVEEKVVTVPPAETSVQPAQGLAAKDSLVKEDAAAEGAMESLSDAPAAVERTGAPAPREVKGSGKTKEEGKKAVVDSGRENQGRQGLVANAPPPANAKATPPAAKVAPPAAAPKVAHVRPEEQAKIRKAPAPENKGGKNLLNVQPPAVKETMASKNQVPVDQIVQKRMAAGSGWTKKGKEDAYTMQLMALTDKNAEEHLKKMLAQPQYRQESGKFYIFRKSANSPVLFVFYGEYPTLAQAHEAQNTLPAFLRIHQPYAISIKGALEKVKGGARESVKAANKTEAHRRS